MLTLLTIFLAIIWIIWASAKLKIHPFISLLLAGIFVGLSNGLGIEKTAKLLAEGFGGLMTKIALIVVLGCLIGVFLEKSGATLQIARFILRIFGKKYPELAITLIGTIVGIPVFCDSGYVILSGLTKPLAREAKSSLASISLGLAGGLYTTHTLLPPHPGPLAVMGNFNIENQMAWVMLTGSLVAVPVTLVVFWSARFLGKKIQIHLQESEESSEIIQLPATWASFLPIFLPITLLILGAFTDIAIFKFLGTPIIALLIGLALSVVLLPSNERKHSPDFFKKGVLEAGMILVLVGAGGAFGAVIKETPLKYLISEYVDNGQGSVVGLMFILFAMGAFFKTAQGSTTASMTIVSAMFAPILANLGIGEPIVFVFLMCSVASGAMIVSHANDAYFWVISYYSGFTLSQGYRSITPLTLLQGVASFIFTLILFFIFQ
jgi:GntP family gluconate:H+ symporter